MMAHESNTPSAESSIAPRILRTAAKGGCLLSAIGFIIGFVGPIIFAPDSPQGPMLGIFFTGPGGFVLGLLIGAITGFVRSRKR
jgi:hypothetical protein